MSLLPDPGVQRPGRKQPLHERHGQPLGRGRGLSGSGGAADDHHHQQQQRWDVGSLRGEMVMKKLWEEWMELSIWKIWSEDSVKR